MPWPKPIPMLPVMLTLSLASCAGAGRTSEPAAVVNACQAVPLPDRLDPAKRAQLADEIEAAPAGAVWPQVVVAENRLVGDLAACRGVLR